jgi:hypothetical protein
MYRPGRRTDVHVAGRRERCITLRHIDAAPDHVDVLARCDG